MLDTSGLFKEWWGLTECHVLNQVPAKNKEITPFKKWENKRLKLSYLGTWVFFGKSQCASPQEAQAWTTTVVFFTALPIDF
jgi:hypothetical protein